MIIYFLGSGFNSQQTKYERVTDSVKAGLFLGCPYYPGIAVLGSQKPLLGFWASPLWQACNFKFSLPGPERPLKHFLSCFQPLAGFFYLFSSEFCPVCAICLDRKGYRMLGFPRVSSFPGFCLLKFWLLLLRSLERPLQTVASYILSTVVVVLRRVIGLEQLLFHNQRESSSQVILVFKN